MKKTKLVTFSIKGKVIEQIEGDFIDLYGVESMKTNLAIIHNVSYDDVELDYKDIFKPELSLSLLVNGLGTLMFKSNEFAAFSPVESVRPSMDINNEDLCLEFLDLIRKKDYDNALIFTKKKTF